MSQPDPLDLCTSRSDFTNPLRIFKYFQSFAYVQNINYMFSMAYIKA